MIQTVEAIYENGILKPLEPLAANFIDGETVELKIEKKRLSPEEMLELASRVYAGLSEEEIDEIEKIALNRSNFFGGRTP